ncbi:unnamed protein product [Nyctereutes procyonoides]|uniref:(raccoon dog) hypothetical protein n=1 Tax=Nyctereutes procyonoides TaxID=34880 RepID=A0A811YD09_NYCPR|nr:unnamed protein product [Nyctereutes procyonoides]
MGPASPSAYPTAVWKLMILLLTYCDKVNSSLTLCYNAYIIHLTSSHYAGILSSHIVTRRMTLLLTPILKSNYPVPEEQELHQPSRAERGSQGVGAGPRRAGMPSGSRGH